MLIKIAGRYCPFSHIAGSKCLIPGSRWIMKVFYSRIVFQKIGSDEKKIIDFDLLGPFKEFTLQQDLEKGFVLVFGKDQKGHFQIAFKPKEGFIHLVVEKVREKSISITYDNESKKLNEKDAFNLNILATKKDKNFERLSLGCHKKQDWDFVKRRDDLREILPFWFHLSQFYEKPFKEHNEGTASIFKNFEKEEVFYKLFHAGFSGILVPRLTDTDYQNIIAEKELSKDADPLLLIQKGGKKIRSLFFEQNDSELMILPKLPSKFICGRFIDIEVKNVGMMDMEWTKRKLRRLILRSWCSKMIVLKLPKGYKDFRFRTSEKEKGKTYSISDPVFLQKNMTYYFDRFQR